MNILARFIGLPLAGALLCSPASAASGKSYSPGASDTEIRIGHSTAYSGPVSAFGASGRTYKAYFDMLNAAGGINGRKVNFITLDDAYSPPKALEQARKLVESDDVLLIAFVSGTPTNTATQKYLNGKGVPQILISTGADKFNAPETYPWTMPFWPSYAVEQKTYIDHALKQKPDAKIGVLYANDDYGKDHLNGVRQALTALGKDKQLISTQSYETADATVDSQILNLKNAGVDVLISASTPKFAAQAIRKAHEIGWKPSHYVANAASSARSVMIPAGAEASKGVMTGAFSKAPDDPALATDPEVIAYLDFMKKWNPKDNANDVFPVVSFIAGNMLRTILEQAGDNLTRENIMKIAGNLKDQRMPMHQPKVTVSTTPDNFDAYKSLQLQAFDGARWVNVD